MKASSTKAVLESRHMFTIYKEGHTTGGPVQIVALKGQPFDIEKKVAFYKAMGYTVTDIQKP